MLSVGLQYSSVSLELEITQILPVLTVFLQRALMSKEGDTNFVIKSWGSLDLLLALPRASCKTLSCIFGVKCCCFSENNNADP